MPALVRRGGLPVFFYSGLHPLAAAGRFENCVADALRLQGSAEVGLRRLAAFNAGHEIGESIQKGVLVPDVVPGTQ